VIEINRGETDSDVLGALMVRSDSYALLKHYGNCGGDL